MTGIQVNQTVLRVFLDILGALFKGIKFGLKVVGYLWTLLKGVFKALAPIAKQLHILSKRVGMFFASLAKSAQDADIFNRAITKITNVLTVAFYLISKAVTWAANALKKGFAKIKEAFASLPKINIQPLKDFVSRTILTTKPLEKNW